VDGIGYLGIFVALVGLAGALWSGIAHARAKARSAAAERWLAAPGRVTATDIQLRSGGSGNSRYAYHVPAISYTYAVRGREHEGHRIRFGLATTNTRRGAEAILAPYPVGATPEVRYNPEDPDDSVLEAGKVGRNLLVAAIFCAFVVIAGAAIVLGAVRGWFSGDVDGRWHARFEVAGIVYEGTLEASRREGPLTLAFTDAQGPHRVREDCAMRRDGQAVRIACRNPRMIDGAGTYSPDNFDLVFEGAATLRGSLSSQAGAATGPALFTRY
jgi:hypothetical protein